LDELPGSVEDGIFLSQDGKALKEAFHVIGQLFGRGISTILLFAKRFQHDRVEIAYELAVELRGGLWERSRLGGRGTGLPRGRTRRRGRGFADDSTNLVLEMRLQMIGPFTGQ